MFPEWIPTALRGNRTNTSRVLSNSMPDSKIHRQGAKKTKIHSISAVCWVDAEHHDVTTSVNVFFDGTQRKRFFFCPPSLSMYPSMNSMLSIVEPLFVLNLIQPD